MATIFLHEANSHDSMHAFTKKKAIPKQLFTECCYINHGFWGKNSFLCNISISGLTNYRACISE